ncbi:MAG: hypothetical protein KF893_02715 [Caldilineaceae bacterium]|nr:hypothetical protein [Caldilineaceae bacterium]
MTTSLSPEEERARKRQAIGLDPRRPRAREAIQLPPEQSGGDGRFWIAVLLLAAMMIATGWMVYDTVRAPSNVAMGSTDLHLLLRDDFSTPQLALASAHVDGVWDTRFEDGHYQILVEQPGNLIWSTLGLLSASTYRVETSMTLVDSALPNEQSNLWGYAGLLARYANPQNFYLFAVDGQGAYQVQRQKEEVWQILHPWTQTPLLKRGGDANLLAVEDDGRQIRFYANGALLFTVGEPRLPSGDAGLMAGTRSQGSARVRFDWVKIYGVPLAPADE